MDMDMNSETGLAAHIARVLVVDDDRAIRDLVRCVLELEGYDVACAANGQEALDLLLSARTPWVVLMDVMMPRVSGIEVCQRLAAADGPAADHQIALMTAGLLEDDACPAPARALIHKPFDVDQIIAVVGALAAGPVADLAARAAAGAPEMAVSLA